MDFVPPAVAQAAVDSGVARCALPPHYKPAPHLEIAVEQKLQVVRD